MDESALNDIRHRNELRKANAIQSDDSSVANADIDELLAEIDSLNAYIRWIWMNDETSYCQCD